MRVLSGLFIAFVIFVVAAVGVGFFLPDEAHVERSTVIEAPPATVYAVLGGFKQFNRWSPWADLDPKTQYQYSGAPFGPGARQKWQSDDPNVGGGSQEILEVTPYSMVKVRLSFDSMSTENQLTYTLTPEGEGTRLVWAMDTGFGGDLLNRYFGLLFDRMIGPDFEKGLSRLESLVESLPKDDFTAVPIEIRELPSRPLASLAGEAPHAESAPVIAAARARIGQFLAASGQRPAGAPLTITHGVDEPGGIWKFDVAVPLDQACTAATEEGGVQCGKSYQGWVLYARHERTDAAITSIFAALRTFKTVAGLEDNGDIWEQSTTDPATTPVADSATDLYWPIK
ncbi:MULTISPECIES: SRPBCC family protein [Hydrocarboniphaga]|uniref:Bacterial transcription activator effector binding domain-containing protein n=1 Tax=Hydrocarboniphaga effusa AP103 TaxID=1172194 RepID=I8T335_9GAMM|nr:MULTISPECIES: SRPBCC family protein [Hydrocarboniphaga]EIT68103.1 hypothetical protein WQQ_45380 [Hydrocarboniphaga effusa AP103]MDZ4078201.1 SRPBCC family protein [Hydrocarboniphaga sp.]